VLCQMLFRGFNHQYYQGPSIQKELSQKLYLHLKVNNKVSYKALPTQKFIVAPTAINCGFKYISIIYHSPYNNKLTNTWGKYFNDKNGGKNYSSHYMYRNKLNLTIIKTSHSLSVTISPTTDLIVQWNLLVWTLENTDTCIKRPAMYGPKYYFITPRT